MDIKSNSERNQTGILFICLGNICRSPLAEGIFQHKLRECGLQDQYIVDSAGTGDWHVGDLADPRMRATALRYGIDLKSRARQVNEIDFKTFDLLLAMDRNNYNHLLDMAKGEIERERVHMMRAFDPDSNDDFDVPDPYFGGDQGFEYVYHMLNRSCERLLNMLENK
ncbi:MAG TPA: protein tyrosine phosphatase [Chloroflexi bacterium]|nr:protein tyrosine phosphatase [Chloroflexota bacterium]